ncbi:MAG: iron-containing alcohol dehydrogenase family protein [Flavobacteriales bacterium AspAUS03]
MVPRVVFGRGAFSQFTEIVGPKRKGNQPFIYLVDHCFEGKTLVKRIPLYEGDQIRFIDTIEEPKTTQVDALRDELQENFRNVSGIIGLGGGSVLDLAKAVALMMMHLGSSAQYQGWDLLDRPGVYHVGIPTLSGTGAEVSRTAVLTGPERKLGLNSDFIPFDQVVLDPELTQGVPIDQRFYTGMDCYIHCVESLNGTYLNDFSKNYGKKALDLCLKVFLKKDNWDEASDNMLMMASWYGGMSITYAQVGVAHAMSYGLSYLLGIKHGVANCIVFDQLEAFYPEGSKVFKQMVEKHQIIIPQGVCAGLSDEQFTQMIQVALGLAPLWENALGKDWTQVITPSILRKIYEKI